MHPEAWSPYCCRGLQTSVYVPVYDCEPFCLRERVCIHSETHVCQLGLCCILQVTRILS